MNDQELARYQELVLKMRAGTLDQTKCEHVEIKALAEQYKEYLRVKLEGEADERQKELLRQAEERRKKDDEARAQQEVDHQLSWLKAVLQVKVDDEKLRDEWGKFREKVQG